MVNNILPVVGGYVVGSIPWGVLLAKLRGVEIRDVGSGNIGATNVARALGLRYGILCFALDLLKGLIPVFLAQRFGEPGDIVAIAAAGAAVAGHVWPFTLGFRGGKGVATTIGALLMISPVSVTAAIVVWLLVFSLKRYVSLASIAAAAVLPLSQAIYYWAANENIRVAPLVLLTGLAGLIVYRHRSNIQRLRRGTESRFEKGCTPR